MSAVAPADRVTPDRAPGRAARRLISLAAAFAVGLSACGHPPQAGAGELYDWCSPVVVRPDQRFRDPKTCEPYWSAEEIAAGARVVLLGTRLDVTSPVFAPDADQCRWPFTHAANGRYVARIRALRAAQGGPPIAFVHMHRFDYVGDTFAALPGFEPGFLLTTSTPWSEVTRFFSDDRGAPCRPAGCSLSDQRGGVERSGRRGLRDWIDAHGAPVSRRSVYYLARSAPGRRRFWTIAALADLRNAQYRAWRVAEAKRALAAGGYDAIMIIAKFHQYQAGARHWIGSTEVPDVATLNARADTVWTARPDGYGYGEYVRGLCELAQELRAAGVPYAFQMPAPPFQWNADDPATPFDEAAAIRRTARDAAYVLLSRARYSLHFERAVRELERNGAVVIPVDPACGQKGRE